jgi:putative transposase
MTTNSTITAGLLDQLLANYEKPKDLTGDEGLLGSSKKC